MLRKKWSESREHEQLHQKYQRLIAMKPNDVPPRLGYARFRFYLATKVLNQPQDIRDNLQAALRDLKHAQGLALKNQAVIAEIVRVQGELKLLLSTASRVPSHF